MAEKKFAVDINLMFNELKSARIENVTADPAVLYAGLFWFNSTSKSLNYSDGTSIYKVAVGGTLEEAITAALTSANSYTDTAITNEVAARDSAIASAIATEDLKVGTDISTAISGEVTARDSAIASAISAEDLKVGTDISTAISSEVTARDSAIASAIAAEDLKVGTDISSAIASEVTARDGAISTAVSSEANLRVQGDADTLNSAKAYTDTKIASLSGDFIGDFNASLGTLPSAAGTKAGSNWRVSVSGTITGLLPVAKLEVGDLIVSKVDNASVVTDFFALQGNLSDVVSTAGSNSDPNYLMFSSGETDRVVTIADVNYSDITKASKTFSISKQLVAGTPVTYKTSNGHSNLTSGVPYMSTVSVIDMSDGEEVFVEIKRTSDTFIILSNVSFNASIIIITPIFVDHITEQL